MLDSHTLVSNAVGAVCFAAAYTVSKTLSRAEAFSDNDEGEDGDWSDHDESTTDDTDAASSSSSFRNTPAPKHIDPDTLFRIRTHLSQTFPARLLPSPLRLPLEELQNEHLSQTHRVRIPAPPLRLPFQELQGDLPLYFDPHTRTWTWLEPFPLDNPEEEARLAREAALRRAHWRTSTPPVKKGMMAVEERVDVVWTRLNGTTTFVRGGGWTVELPEGEYFPLVEVQGLPFFGLGPPSADATYLTTHGWVPGLDKEAAPPPLTPSPSKKRKCVHFPDLPISSIKLVERLEYKVSRSRTDGDVRAALRRVRRALEELEDLLLLREEGEEGGGQVEDPFVFTYGGEQQEENAREGHEHATAREEQEQEQPNARERQEQPDAQHTDLYTPTKPTAVTGAATRAPFQLLTPSSLERPAPYRVPSAAHRAYRASSAPPELYSPTPAPPSTTALSGLREDSPTPVGRRMNGR
ncbi:hypothetical protein EXIGLDRAFT_830135 [Exidia glandulosa HHB12029]|uniref:Uncharacterized protein n=1 Tax=Exidia glandulosa HHB12029 TaxID=1314781 RepID=A0A166BIP0_EXIGL|nr:hypothetical protein EXIGLDRAFT_830135 [Exidia glandulosa HHB12029]